MILFGEVMAIYAYGLPQKRAISVRFCYSLPDSTDDAIPCHKLHNTSLLEVAGLRSRGYSHRPAEVRVIITTRHTVFGLIFISFTSIIVGSGSRPSKTHTRVPSHLN